MKWLKDHFSIDAAIAKGRPLPDWAEDSPDLADGDQFYLDEFWDLNSERQLGFGVVGEIPVSRIRARARDLGLERDVEESFKQIIRKLDEVYLEFWTKDGA